MATVTSAARLAVGLPRFRWDSLGLWLLLAVVVLFVGFPIAMVVAGAFNVAGPGEAYRFGTSNWEQAAANPQIRTAVGYTVAILLVRMAIGFPVGILLAWLIARTNLPGAKWFEFGMWLTFFLPTLAVLQGWIFLLEGHSGLLNQWISRIPFVGRSPLDIFSFWGIVWVHLMSHTIASIFILLVEAFKNMDGELEDAARVCGTSELSILQRITLPLMRPVIAMAVVLAIIRGLQSFEIERVLGASIGIPVYATLIVEMLRDQPPQTALATALSVVVLLVLIPLVILQRVYVGDRQYTTVTSRMRPTKIDLRGWKWPAFIAVLVFQLMCMALPLSALLLGSFMKRFGYFSVPEPWTLNHWQAVLTDSTFKAAFTNSIVFGVLSGIAGTLAMFVIAHVLVRTRFQGRGILDFVSWLPWAIPGVLLSLGMLTMILGIPALRWLHGSAFVLIIAIILFRFPLGVHLLKGGLMQLGKELEEASQVAGGRWWQTQIRVNLPILAPMLITVALMTFVTAMNEVSGVILLAAAGTRTLSLLSLDLLASQHAQKEAASVVTILIVLLSVAVTLIARRVGGLRA